LTNIAAPRWLRLDRSGDTFTAYQSANGVTWTWLGSDTIAMAPTVYVGLGGSSTSPTTTSTSTFDNVTVTPGTPVPPVTPPSAADLPGGWMHADIGDVGFTGDATFDAASNTFAVKGGGNDVYGSADAFHYVYRTLTGDGFIVARLKSLQNTSTSAKGGVMIRETLQPGSPNAYMQVMQGKGTAFQRRQTAGGSTLNTPGTLNKAPWWVKLERIGHTVNAYQSADGTTWTLVGTDTVVMGQTVYVGIAAVSHNVMATTTAAFDSVSGGW